MGDKEKQSAQDSGSSSETENDTERCEKCAHPVPRRQKAKKRKRNLRDEGLAESRKVQRKQEYTRQLADDGDVSSLSPSPDRVQNKKNPPKRQGYNPPKRQRYFNPTYFSSLSALRENRLLHNERRGSGIGGPSTAVESNNVASTSQEQPPDSQSCEVLTDDPHALVQDHGDNHGEMDDTPVESAATAGELLDGTDEDISETLESPSIFGYFQVSENLNQQSYFQGSLRISSQHIYRVQGPDEISVMDFLNSFESVVQSMVNESLGSKASPNDFIRVILHSRDGTSHPVSTKFFRVSDFNVSLVMTALLQAAQSGLAWKVGEGVEIEIKIVKLPEDPSRSVGGGKKRFSSVNLELTAKQKRSIIEIANADDENCMARAVVVCLAKKKFQQSEKTTADENAWRYVRDGRRIQQCILARQLCEEIGADPMKPCGIAELKKMESITGYYVKVIAGDMFNTISYDGVKENPRESLKVADENVIFLFRRLVFLPNSSSEKTYHYDAVVNHQAFFEGKQFFCHYCNHAYRDIHSHKCSDIHHWCYSCWDRNCEELYKTDSSQARCDICGVLYRNSGCREKHERLEICRKFVYCMQCRKKFERSKHQDSDGNQKLKTNFEALAGHSCVRTCGVCKEEVSEAFHNCYLQPTELKTPSDKLMFLDFESEQSGGLHVPILCYISWYNERLGNWEEKCFGLGANILDDVGKFIFSPKFEGFTIIAHNMKGYDGCFLLRYLGENNLKPLPILSGRKITSIFITALRIRIIDSLNFLTMPLSGFAKAFGLQETKGYFPHFFSHPENFEYIGVLPPCNTYGDEFMKPEAREHFLEWYNSQKAAGVIFNFRADIERYCRQDVIVLRDGCLAFKKLLMELTEQKCDPFCYNTLAGVAAAIYRANFLKPKMIAAVPPNGYAETQAFSSKSLEWLEFMRLVKGETGLKHVGNSAVGEGEIGQYRVDGLYEEKKTVFEFNGCHYHGCKICYSNKKYEVHPTLKVTYETLNKKTQAKKAYLKSVGYKVISMWECQWESMKKEETGVSEFVARNKFSLTPMNPFDAFMGGRVETFRMLVEDEGEMNYVDFTSLYPFINATKQYPVGHPEIILNNFGDTESACERFFGFMKCEILPPRGLHVPVLPGKYGQFKKLLFVLCRTCAETCQINPCSHSENERTLTGTWFTPELRKAVEKGYVIRKILGVYHFEQKTDELFADFIRLFYKLKLTSSGIPKDCDTAEKLQEYIKKVEEQEQIKIRVDEFENNPGKRQISKLLINSLWGRYGLRRNKPKSEFCTSIGDASKFFDDSKYEVCDMIPFHENLALLTYKISQPDFLDINNDANVYIAAATTAYARLELYSKLDVLGERVVYCDTDSIIYMSQEGSNLETGNFLGQLTDELKGDPITSFVSGGPKNYGFKTTLGDLAVKAKGFAMNFVNSKKFTFETMKELVLDFLTPELDDEFEDPLDGINTVPINKFRTRQLRNKMVRDKVHADVHSLSADKPSAHAGGTYISFFNPAKITRSQSFQLLKTAEQKLYTVNYDKRIVYQQSGKTMPYGF